MHRTITRPRFLVWGTLVALFVSGLSGLQAQDAGQRPSAVIVGIGQTIRLQMKSKNNIKTVVNPKDNVINIRTVLGDPTTILITGQQPDVVTIELTDDKNNSEKYEIIVQLDVEYLRTQLRRAVPTANITPIPTSVNTVVLTGTVAHATDVDIVLKVAQSIGGIQVINALQVGGVQQVQLDVVVVAVSRQTNRSMGFDWAGNARLSFFGSYVAGIQAVPGSIGTAGALSTYPISGLTSIPGGGPTFLFGVLHSTWGFLGFLQALRTEGLAKFITQPSLVTLSGRPATFLVGGDQAVPVVGGIGGATGVSFEPFGTKLDFLPIVLGNGKIHMEVSPSITDLDPAFGTIVLGNVVPGRRRSSVNTTVEMESGQTFVIGGLTRHTTAVNTRKFPVLGDLPFLGVAFSEKGDQDLEEELLILVTPHLVDAQDCAQLTKILPGQETRNPDDFELFLEGILEAPRGPRQVCHNRRYVPAYKNGPSTEVFPCAGGTCGVTGCGLPSYPPLLPGGESHGHPAAAPALPMPPGASSAPLPPGPVPFSGVPAVPSGHDAVASPPVPTGLANPVPPPPSPVPAIPPPASAPQTAGPDSSNVAPVVPGIVPPPPGGPRGQE
jgi:pilus assembly protein CpaC